jgi:uncharacterized damage-inducible protein DinB
MTIAPAIREAWRRNLEVNRTLVDHLDPEMLAAQTPGGGFTVAQHLAHIVRTVKLFGARLDRERMHPLPDLDDDERDPQRIAEVQALTARAALEASEAHPEGSAELPHADASAYLMHAIAHDAHHRGQILLALKTNGHALPGQRELWGPWFR